MSVVERTSESFQQIQSRFTALRQYTDTPMPSRSEHLWRYSDPAAFFPRGPLTTRASAVPPHPYGEARGCIEVELFPHREPALHLNGADSAHLTIEPLAVSREGSALSGKAVTSDHGIFEALNAAIWSQGVFVKLSAGRRLAQPVRIRRFAARASAYTRLVVVVEPDAELTLVEELVGGGDDHFVFSTSEIFVRHNAKMSHVLHQTWSPGTVGHITSRANLERDAALRTAVIALGGRRFKADVGAVLNGVGAESRLFGVSLSDKRQTMDLHTVHDHQGERTRSRIDFKAALFDKSTSAYTGLIRVGEKAELSEAFQENRNLLLSDKCRADSIPELEIENSEVQCTHAATAAPIDENQLFYLKSRGIEESEAVAILVNGFFDAALSPLPQTLKPDIERTIAGRLHEHFDGGPS